MKNSKLRSPKVLLKFNEYGVLSSLYYSIRSAAKDSDSNAQAISFACTGKYISAGAHYYRHLHPNVEIESSDLGSLKVKEYDDMCNEVRRYHPISEMVRQRHIKNNKRVRKKCNCKCNCKKNNNNDE